MRRPHRSILLPGPVVRMAALIFSAAMVGLCAVPAGAQTFFAESDVLRADSALELTFSDLIDRSRTERGAAAEFSDVDSSLRRAAGRYRRGVLALGAMTEARRFQEVADTFTQRDDRDQSAGYVALALEELIAGNDELFFVLSTGGREQTFQFDGYRRDLDASIPAQGGLVYRIGFLILGYIQGREELDLTIADGAATVTERYAFDYSARLAGLRFGDPADVGLLLVWQRKDTPAVPGTTIDLREGFEELQRAALAVGAFTAEYAQTRIREEFTGDSRRLSTEREVTLSVTVNDSIVLAVSQKRIDDEQGFTLLGVPGTDTTDRTENLLRIGFRF